MLQLVESPVDADLVQKAQVQLRVLLSPLGCVSLKNFASKTVYPQNQPRVLIAGF